MARFNKMHIKKLFMPDGKDKGQLDKMSQVTATASELNIMDGVTATAAELNLNSGLTATAAELNQLDASVNGALMAPGSGIVSSATTIIKYGIINAGGIVTTQIMIDLTGLNGGGTADDIIGDDGIAVANCHIGQITTAINGVIWGGEIRCLETPAGGNVDINLSNASIGTGVQDADVKALTNYAELIDCGNHTAGDAPIELTALPTANYYLYLSAGTSTDADFSAGRLLITLWGYKA